MSEHIWAPELHYLFGKWVIYFAGGDKDDVWEIRPYVLICTGDDPYEDPWIEAGQMQCADDDEFSFRAFSLDATTFEDNGTRYFVWAEKTSVGKKISNLYIAKMESEVKLATMQVLLTTPDYDWERVGFWVNEGPAVLRRNDELYLTFSASETGISYCVGMLTAKSGTDLLDPLNWHKQRWPVLKSDEKLGIYGPGHNSFTTDEDGREIMIYHARTEAEIVGNPLYNPNRLDRESGLALHREACAGKTCAAVTGDHIKEAVGVCLARRPGWQDRAVEGPYLIFHKDTGYYYLFVSYGSLKSDYQIRVGRSRTIEGPYLDSKGKRLTDTETEETPGNLLMAGYRWNDGKAWMAPGHNSVLCDDDGL